jgi:hypothetical protein
MLLTIIKFFKTIKFIIIIFIFDIIKTQIINNNLFNIFYRLDRNHWEDCN